MLVGGGDELLGGVETVGVSEEGVGALLEDGWAVGVTGEGVGVVVGAGTVPVGWPNSEPMLVPRLPPDSGAPCAVSTA